MKNFNLRRACKSRKTMSYLSLKNSIFCQNIARDLSKILFFQVCRIMTWIITGLKGKFVM